VNGKKTSILESRNKEEASASLSKKTKRRSMNFIAQTGLLGTFEGRSRKGKNDWGEVQKVDKSSGLLEEVRSYMGRLPVFRRKEIKKSLRIPFCFMVRQREGRKRVGESRTASEALVLLLKEGWRKQE